MKSACAVAKYSGLCSMFNLTLPNVRDVLIDGHSLPDFLKNSPKTINQIKILYNYSWQSRYLKLEDGDSEAGLPFMQ